MVLFISPILNFLGSPSLRRLRAKLIEFQHYYAKIVRFSCIQNLSSANTKPTDSEIPNSEYCNSCRKLISSKTAQTLQAIKTELRAEDVETVVERLGLGGLSEDPEQEKCRNYLLFDGVVPLLEDKEASMEELKEAFSVFDKNRDGFIDAGELQMVMSRLEMNEGLREEDCVKMIRAFDLNGDGRIDLNEFKNMLENVL